MSRSIKHDRLLDRLLGPDGKQVTAHDLAQAYIAAVNRRRERLAREAKARDFVDTDLQRIRSAGHRHAVAV